MLVKQTVNEWKPTLTYAIDSKVSEFIAMGYTRTTDEEVWKCLQQKVWQGNPVMPIHEAIQDVMHLNVNVFMSYLTFESYQNEDLMASIAALTGDK